MAKLVLKKSSRPTGLASVGWEPYYSIEYKKQKIGQLYRIEKYSNLFKISLSVLKEDINEDGNPNCKWKWINLKMEYIPIEDIKEYLDRNIKQILNFNLHYIK